MSYREVTDVIKNYLEPFNYSVVGRMHKLYTEKFIIDCVMTMAKSNFKHMNPKERGIYLMVICINSCTAKDMIKKAKNIDYKIGDFDV